MEQESKEFAELLEHANMLIERDADKNKAQTEMMRLHRLEWGEDIWKKPENVRETRDTQPFDAVNWSVDILSVHAPTITIELPREQPEEESGGIDPLAQMGEIAMGAFDDPMGGMGMPGMMGGMDPMGMDAPLEQAVMPEEEYNPTELAETLESVTRVALAHNDKRRKSALIRDFLYSVFLFDEVVAKVADLRMSPQWDRQPASANKQLPFAIKACLPMTVHSEWDEFGLAGVLHRYKRSLREIKNQYSDVNGAVQLFEADPDGNVVYCEWWTRDEMCQWIEKSGIKSTESTDSQNKTQSELLLKPIEKNTLGFIPFVMRTGRGSQLFEMSEEQISPLLYGGWKSKIFFRANLFLSVVSTLAFAQSNPKWVYKSETGEKTLDLNFNYPEILPAKIGEDIDPLTVGVNEDLYKMMQEFASRSERTTISQVVAGQVPQGVSAAAAINLMVQGSKLTIVPAQNAVGEVYAMLAHMIFDYVRAYGEGDLKVMVRDGVRPLSPSQIPEWMDISVTLRSEMPQDKALLYNVALNAWKQGFISQETGWDMVGIEDKVKERERLDMEIRNATPEEMMQGKVSEPAQQMLQAEQQAQMEQQAQAQQMPAETNVGDATTAALSGGLGVEQNPQAGGGIIDQLSAMQNAISNPMGG